MRADPFFIQNSLVSLDQAQFNQQQLVSEMASGVSVTSLSVNPTAAAQDSLIANEINVDDTFTQTAATTGSLMQVTSSTLTQVVQALQSAITEASSAANGTNNSSDETSLAAELSGIRATILGLANTNFQGVSIFAGSQATATAFTLTTSTNPATVTYNGDSDVLSIPTPSGGSIQTAIPGDQIFGGNAGTTGANVLGVLNQLISDVTAGNTTAIAADTTAVNTSLNQVAAIQAKLDSSLATLNTVSNFNQTQTLQLQATQTSLVAVNQEQAATELSNNEVQQDALLSVMAEVEKSNDLFDFLD